jgi:sugar phosphate isomerase/epimerase
VRINHATCGLTVAHVFCMPDQWTEMHNKIVDNMMRLRALVAEARALNKKLMTVHRASSFVAVERQCLDAAEPRDYWVPFSRSATARALRRIVPIAGPHLEAGVGLEDAADQLAPSRQRTQAPAAFSQIEARRRTGAPHKRRALRLARHHAPPD